MYVYKITNKINNKLYIGITNNYKKRWANHKCKSAWNEQPNNQMYIDMQNYGIEKFEFEILAEVEPEKLKETEQEFIETLKPTYNSNRANGWDFERYKEYKNEHQKEYQKEYNNQLCFYNGENLTLNALVKRFRRAGIEHCVLEAKKHLLK